MRTNDRRSSKSMGIGLWLLTIPMISSAVEPERVCGTRSPDINTLQEMRQVALTLRQYSRSFLRTIPGLAEPVRVPTRIHVVSRSDQRGAVSDAVLEEQMRMLNAAYRPMRIVFQLTLTTREANDDWFDEVAESEVDSQFMRKINIRGGSDLLLVVRQPRSIVDGKVKEVLGYAHLPSNIANGKVPRMFDAVVLDWKSLPRGEPTTGLGNTTIHEVGHWLGLLHTFEPGTTNAGQVGDGCDPVGDGIDDTNAQRFAVFACDKVSDTCPAPGRDPLANYMGYGYDSCTSELTPDQSEYALSMLVQYRPQFLSPNKLGRQIFGDRVK